MKRKSVITASLPVMLSVLYVVAYMLVVGPRRESFTAYDGTVVKRIEFDTAIFRKEKVLYYFFYPLGRLDESLFGYRYQEILYSEEG